MSSDEQNPKSPSLWERLLHVAIPTRAEIVEGWNEPGVIFTQPKNWNRVFLLMLFVAVAAIVVGFVRRPPVDHYLQKVPRASMHSVEVAKFEAAFDVYLAGIAIPTLGGLLTLLLTSREPGRWRNAAVSAVNHLFFAISLVTCGYALRNFWMVSNRPIPNWIVNLDTYVFGPFTAAAFVLAIGMLVNIGYAGLPDVMASRRSLDDPSKNGQDSRRDTLAESTMVVDVSGTVELSDDPTKSPMD